MKKLIVHMGAHRCASSATQAFLRRNCAENVRDVRIVLRSDLLARTDGFAMTGFYRNRPWHPAYWRDMASTRAAIKACPQDMIVVSEENLMGLMPGHEGAGFYPGFANLCRALAKLRSVAEVLPRLVVRRQDRLLESIYGFRVAFGLRQDFADYIRPFLGQDLSWYKMAQALDAAGLAGQSRIDVLEAWPREGTTEHLMDFLCVPNLQLGGGGLRMGNSRFSEEALELMLAMNRTGTGVDVDWRRKVLFPALRQGAAPTVQFVADLLELQEDQTAVLKAALQIPARFSLTNEERAAILAACEAGNKAFLKHTIVGASGDIWD
ncbi:hypothetical protein [Kordiimonas gwangyangensis]|uniref:hypothetical protein n=1 Tax=Kordiimonas gwangyangensis TaxID=288022 RepID=UPI00037ECD26|nr:hypothetical protein [Kordiimonas gwangyangensis]